MTIYSIDKEKSYKASKVTPTKFALKYGLLYVILFWILFIGKTLALETPYAVVFFFVIIFITVLGEKMIMSKLLNQRLNNQYVELTSDELIRHDRGRRLKSVFLNRIVTVEEKKAHLYVKTQDNTYIVIPDIFDGYDDIKRALLKKAQV
ncbi:hypothetical protein GCM10023188_12980 [Pontibacter saemangeumensis]|uniref:PH domain-containing protein n=1 Tax=Pontibacter saemangeumensis TaxID=1084525 RepID=A0ABP8LFA6_9BACT